MRLGGGLAGKARVVTSPAACAMETAELLGCDAHVLPALADMDYGEWTGRSFADIHAAAPEPLLAWLADPAGGAPGGEGMDALAIRVGGWVDGVAAADTATLAITHASVVRAVLIHALAAPAAVALSIDLAPLSRTILSFNNGRWRLQAIVPAGEAGQV